MALESMESGYTVSNLGVNYASDTKMVPGLEFVKILEAPQDQNMVIKLESIPSNLVLQFSNADNDETLYRDS